MQSSNTIPDHAKMLSVCGDIIFDKRFMYGKIISSSGQRFVSHVYTNNKNAITMVLGIHVILVNFVCSTAVGKFYDNCSCDLDGMEAKKETSFHHSEESTPILKTLLSYIGAVL